MGRQRNNPQSKGMEDCPVKELNEMEASKVSDIEFKRIVIRMFKECSANCKELTGNLNSMEKEIGTVNKNKEEMKNAIYEIKKYTKRNYKLAG